MGLEVYWTEFSEMELAKIFSYYNEVAGFKIAKNLIEAIINETLKLEHQPEMGQVEELLKNRKQQFRYLVFKN